METGVAPPAFVAAVKAEIARLNSVIAAAQGAVSDLERFLSRHAGVPASDVAPDQTMGLLGAGGGATPQPERARTFRQPSPERARATEAVAALLSQKSELVTISALYDYVAGLGIKIGGNKPAYNLSAMLSSDKRFKSHGRAGWSLARDDETPNETEAAGSPTKDAPATSDAPRLTSEGPSGSVPVDPAQGGGT